ncbi:hypothetical protein PMAYCL1PPCAC_14460 [Pristionchus mayeri]|uniref:Uncharacterized protein n=1 Tax=Pristionchus mayeri TaxID=1317129 RepID=A0AAN4ZVD7_9BILA|nr:hypothetical protein PMAYCL1PPCAC_14460 [Pristionchus mayeri]
MVHQHLWVKSLGLDEEVTKRELERFRTRVAAKEDIRWCDKHFGLDGLPLQVPTFIQCAEKSNTFCSKAPLERRLGDGPALSLSQLQVASQESAKSSLQPERIDSTISSVPTLGKSDPSFRPSQCSQSTTDSEEEEEIDTESPVRSKYFLVDKANLEQLFRRCQECGGIIDPTSVCWKQKASALWATYQCTECKKWGRWDNQPKRGSGRSQVHELNQSIPVAAFITGTPIARLLDLFELLGIGVPSERSMRDSVRFYACPAIDRVFAVWERDARDLSKEAAPMDGIMIALDGQYDSPGWTSSNGKVTAFDAGLRLIVACVSLSVKDDEIGTIIIV